MTRRRRRRGSAAAIRRLLVAFADGSAHFIPKTVEKATLQALFTRNGGEVVKLP